MNAKTFIVVVLVKDFTEITGAADRDAVTSGDQPTGGEGWSQV